MIDLILNALRDGPRTTGQLRQLMVDDGDDDRVDRDFVMNLDSLLVTGRVRYNHLVGWSLPSSEKSC